MNIPENPYYKRNLTILGVLRRLFVNQTKKERDYEHALRLKEIYDRTMMNRATLKSIYQRRMEEMGYFKKGE